MNWYAVCTKPGVGYAVFRKLRQAGIEVFNPKLRIRKFVRNACISPLDNSYVTLGIEKAP